MESGVECLPGAQMANAEECPVQERDIIPVDFSSAQRRSSSGSDVSSDLQPCFLTVSRSWHSREALHHEIAIAC